MTDTDIKFVKTRKVKSPLRASNTDAGIDLFIPTLDDDLSHKIMANSFKVWPVMDKKNLKKIVALSVKPGGRILIPSGLHFRIPEGTALVAFNKSGVATKYGLTTGACVCDSSYQGEVHISLINTSTEDITITSNQKIIQFLLLPVFHNSVTECKSLVNLYKEHDSERGDGGFGSTDK